MTREEYISMANARGLSGDRLIAAIKLHRERTGDSLHEALEAVATGNESRRASYSELVKELETAVAWIEEPPNEHKPTAVEILPQLRAALARSRP